MTKLEIRFVERGICPIASPQRLNCSYNNKDSIAYFSLRMRETVIFPLLV